VYFGQNIPRPGPVGAQKRSDLMTRCGDRAARAGKAATHEAAQIRWHALRWQLALKAVVRRRLSGPTSHYRHVAVRIL
jgi:hypothetical protein